MPKGNDKKKRILTLDQLVSFCENSKLYNFNSNDTGYTLSVQIPAEFSGEISSDKGMFYAPIRICHTELNRNKSYISEENMKRAMPSLKYRPFLAHIHQLDSGEWDFHTHDMKIVENEDGKEEIEYIENQIGCITADEPTLVYDEEMDKTYVQGVVAIPEEYTKGADIIRRKNGTKVSCELDIEFMEFNAKKHRLELIDFYFSGVTGLGAEKDGTEIGEGMLGSRVSLEDFSSKNNSSFSHFKENDSKKLIELLETLNEKIDNFNINNNSRKEDETVSKFEELLSKYEKTIEDVTFEYEGLSDEELEAKFAEVFEDDGTGEGDGEDPNVTPEVDPEPEVDPVVENNELKYAVTLTDGSIKEFALSLDEIECALYELVNTTYGEADNCWYSVSVYEDKTLIMHDYWGNKHYRQSYDREEDNFSLKGDRTEVFCNWLTKAEEDSITELRSNYSAMQEKLSAYELAEANANKDALLASTEYSSISEKDEYKELLGNHAEYSVDDLKAKLDGILLEYAKKGALTFAAKPEEKKPEVKVTKLPMNTGKNAKRGKYGKLFAKSED